MSDHAIPTAGAGPLHPKWREPVRESPGQSFLHDVSISPHRDDAKAHAVFPLEQFREVTGRVIIVTVVDWRGAASLSCLPRGEGHPPCCAPRMGERTGGQGACGGLACPRMRCLLERP